MDNEVETTDKERIDTEVKVLLNSISRRYSSLAQGVRARDLRLDAILARIPKSGWQENPPPDSFRVVNSYCFETQRENGGRHTLEQMRSGMIVYDFRPGVDDGIPDVQLPKYIEAGERECVVDTFGGINSLVFNKIEHPGGSGTLTRVDMKI